MYQAPTDIDPAVRALIRRKVHRLVGRHGFTVNDREDLTQELALQAHVASSHFDPARAKAVTFYEHVLCHKAASLVRYQQAQKRRRCRVRHSDGDVLFSWAADAKEDLSADVRDAIRRLPPCLRNLALYLQNQNLAEASRTLGLTRQQARSRRDVIAEYFRAAGFGPESKYYSRSSTNSSGDCVNNCQRRAPMTGHKVEAVTAPQRSCAHAA